MILHISLYAHMQAALRKAVLLSLVETPKPSEDIPPARLPTKEEKELIKLSLSLEHVRVQNSAGSHSNTYGSNTRGSTAEGDGSMVIGEMGTNSYLSLNQQSSSAISPSQSTRLVFSVVFEIVLSRIAVIPANITSLVH